MTPIINVEWEHHRQNRVSIDLLATRVQQLSNGVRLNQVSINEIKQQLADGIKSTGGDGMGFPLFKNAQYFKFVLPPNTPTKVVESLPEPGLRQLIFKGTAITFLEYRGADHILDSPIELHPGMVFVDDYDGGDEVWALSPSGATIYIQVRTADASNSSEDDFVIPFKAEPIISASISDDGHEASTLKGFKGNNVGAYRALDIVSFHPGQTYTFSIEVAEVFAPWLVEESSHPDTASGGSRYGGKVIEVYAPNLYANLPEMALNYIGNIPARGWGYSLIGAAKRNGWVASLGKSGGTFEFTPDFSRRHLFFFARVGEYNAGDWGTGIAEAVSFTYDGTTKIITIVGA